MSSLLGGSRPNLVLAGAVAAGLAAGVALSWLPKLLEEQFMPFQFRNLVTLLRSNYNNSTLHIFVRFGLADVLAGGPALGMTAEQLAAEVGVSPTHLRRVLRLMTVLDDPVVTMDDKHRFRLTRLGRYFTAAHPDGCRHLALTWYFPVLAGCRNQLLENVRTGTPGLNLAWGDNVTVWDVFTAQDKRNGTADGKSIMAGPRIDVPCEVSTFDDCMSAISRSLAPIVAAGYPWGRFRRLADVGGAGGALLHAVLARHPRGIESATVLDLPQVVTLAVEAERGRPDANARLAFLAADFFSPLPPALEGTDAVVMKHILHDWPDERCAAILANVRGVLAAPGGKLLLVEHVVPEPPYGAAALPVLGLDLEMMVCVDGKERSRSEWSELLSASGFRVEEWRLLVGTLNIIVAGLA